ncbi:MAG: PhnA domain-containing protein [Mariprofundus sp.]|nr:PhnA domain-containing protein [Mariprofundus sp.]
MSIGQTLQTRSDGKCELCAATDALAVYVVPASADSSADSSVLLCGICRGQIEPPETLVVNHWRCLNDSMWSQVPAVQVMAWRLLHRLKAEGWPQDLLDMMYLEDDVQAWAEADTQGDGQADAQNDGGDAVKHVDSHGAVLAAGDTVTLIKDLNVKGAGFTAKRGTAVRGIALVSDKAEHIEGRVNGQQIVILTKFVKKSN